MPIDYRPGYARYLEGLGDSFDSLGQAYASRRSREEYKRQNDLAEKRLKQQEERERQDRAVKSADRNKKIFGELSDLVRSGRMSEAEAYAAAAQYEDPKTGELRGVQFHKPEAPDEAPSVAPRDFSGYQQTVPVHGLKPVLGSEGQRMGLKLDPTIEAMLGGTPEPLPPKAPSQLAPVSEAYPRRTKPAITTPDGRTVEFDPEEGKQAKLREAEETAARLEQQASREVDPAMRMAALNAAARIRASIPGAEAAQLQRVETQRLGQDFTADQNKQYNLTADQKYRIGMRPRASGNPVKTQKAEADLEKKELDIDQEYWEAGEKTARMLGFVDAVKQRAKLEEMTAQIAGSENNAALASIVAGSFTKYAQGGTGVISDADLRFFWQKIGGLGIRTEQMFNDAVNGNLGADKKRIVDEAVQTLIGSSRKRETELGQAIATSVGSRGGGKGKQYVPAILQAMTPRYYQSWQKEQAAGGNQQSLDAVEAEIDARLQRRKAR